MHVASQVPAVERELCVKFYEGGVIDRFLLGLDDRYYHTLYFGESPLQQGFESSPFDYELDTFGFG